MKLANTTDKKLKKISALLHGDSGIGKTSSALTLPPDRTMLAVGERGTLPLCNKSYPVLYFNTWDDIRDIYWMFNKPEEIEDQEIKKAVEATTVLFIDSLTECSDLCMQHIITVERKELIKDRTSGAEDAPKGIYEDQLRMEDWGLYGSKILKMISNFTHLPISVIFTSRSKWTTGRNGGNMTRKPSLSGRAVEECPSHFDLVMYMEVSEDGGSRVWRTFHDGEIEAKNGTGTALEPFEETNWTKLFTKILKGNGDGSK